MNQCLGRLDRLRFAILAAFAALALLAAARPAAAAGKKADAADEAAEGAADERLKIDWVEGPKKVSLGTLAELDLPATAVFAGEKDTQKILKHFGNVVDGSELGFISPKADDESWFIVFEWEDVGYVKDDDKDKIDADALLKSLREGTEEANAERKKAGHPALHVIGWAEAPHYDAKSHNLTWAVLARNDDGHESVNYNVRVLGRSGVMSVTLVEDPDKLAASKPAVEKVLGAFRYKQGNRYAEWVAGDKVAEYGLTALVAAGAGAAAVKLGLFAGLFKLLAKGGKLIVMGLAALGGLVAKFWNALRGKQATRRAPPAQPSAHADGDFRGPPGPGAA